jgi:hypothetical protein
MNILAITPIRATDTASTARGLPDWEELAWNKIVLVNTLK